MGMVKPSSQESRASTEGAPPISVEWKVLPSQEITRPLAKMGLIMVMSFKWPVP